MKKRFAVPVRSRGKLLVLLAVFGSLFATIFGCSEGSKAETGQGGAPTAPVVKAARKNVSNELEIASEMLPFQEIDVYAKVSGYIQKLNVDYGSHVKQGQLLATLEIPEFQQQLAQDDAAVHGS